MSVRVVRWHEANPEALRDLYTKYPFPPYFGSPIVNDRLQAYRFGKIREDAGRKREDYFAVDVGGTLIGAAQLRRVDHLSDHFGVAVASIGNEAFLAEKNEAAFSGCAAMLRALRDLAMSRGYRFVTSAVSSQAVQWLRGLEEAGFRYADGFIHCFASIDDDYEPFRLDHMAVRDPVESDFDEIAYSYAHMPFPNHLLHEPEFRKDKIIELYVKRYRETHERLGKVFVAEVDGKFAGAINSIIDHDIRHTTGMVVNHLSQGMVIHPREAGKGVSLALIAARHPWYREQGLHHAYYGANINNIGMIRGLQKMAARHAGIEISMMLRIA
jgi:RimJ/RimL family protein N-acetyltransferase